MWAALIGLALAGPLDRPDPDDMGRYRCTERPLSMANNVPLGQRTLGEGPPGPPVYPAGIGSSLVPYASDEALRKADKHKRIVYPAAMTLATRGEPVVGACQNRAPDDSYFSFGCTEARACDLYTKIRGEAVVLRRRPQTASKFAPIEEVRDAVGLVAFYEPDLFLPLTPGELAAWAREAAEGYRRIEPEVPWVEVEEHSEGWLVRAPRRVHCGCDHDIVRRAYWIARDGRGCAVEEAPVPLAQAVDPMCVD